MGDHVLRYETEVYCWEGLKPKMTLSGAPLGTLVLTDRHLIFLSNGAHEEGRHFHPADSSGTIDLRTLVNNGGFTVPLHHIDEVRPATRWDRTKYLSLRLRTDDGAPVECALMRRVGMPDAQGWAQNVTKARAAALH